MVTPRRERDPLENLHGGGSTAGVAEVPASCRITVASDAARRGKAK